MYFIELKDVLFDHKNLSRLSVGQVGAGDRWGMVGLVLSYLYYRSMAVAI